MKKLLISSALALSSVFAVTACASVNATTDTAPAASMQKHHQGGMHKGHMMGPMSQLNLTSAQQTEIQAIRQNSRGNRMQQYEAVRAVLTVEQREKLDKLKSEMKHNRQQGTEHRGMHKKQQQGM